MFLQCHLSMTFLINYDFSHVYTQHQWFDIQTLFQKGDLLFPFSCNAIYPWLCFNPLYVFTYSPFHLTNLEKSFFKCSHKYLIFFITHTIVYLKTYLNAKFCLFRYLKVSYSKKAWENYFFNSFLKYTWLEHWQTLKSWLWKRL